MDSRVALSPTTRVHPIASYKFGVKDAKPDKDTTPEARLARMEQMFESEGVRKVGALIISF